jgi:hypothetical protein
MGCPVGDEIKYAFLMRVRPNSAMYTVKSGEIQKPLGSFRLVRVATPSKVALPGPEPMTVVTMRRVSFT